MGTGTGLTDSSLNLPPPEIHTPSPYEQNTDTLQTLSKHPLPLLNDEKIPESYFPRIVNMHDRINNNRFLLSLFEEEKRLKKHNVELPSTLKQRAEIHRSLLLEFTEKIALSHLPVATKTDPNTHILLSPYANSLLTYSHDGQYLAHLLSSSGKTWFADKEILPWIQRQESTLKETFWFRGDQQTFEYLQEQIPAVITCCTNVWNSLLEHQSHTPHDDLLLLAEHYHSLRTYIHQQKRTYNKSDPSSYSQINLQHNPLNLEKEVDRFLFCLCYLILPGKFDRCLRVVEDLLLAHSISYRHGDYVLRVFFYLGHYDLKREGEWGLVRGAQKGNFASKEKGGLSEFQLNEENKKEEHGTLTRVCL